jgi:FlaA1/EpsC-like NDP-sugar epimerase
MVSVTANDTAQAAPAREPWSRILANRLVLTDFLVIVWSVVGTQVARFGGFDPNVAVNRTTNETGLNYTLISVILIVAWMAVLALFQTRDERVIGTGNTEYRRIVDATIRLFGVVAIVAFLLQLNLARSYIIIALPTGLIVLLLSRWIWRQWLAVQRSHGLFSARVMLVGSRASVIAIARDLIRTPQAGYLVVGACIPGDTKDSLLPGTVIPVFSDLDQLHDALEDADADTVVITR